MQTSTESVPSTGSPLALSTLSIQSLTNNTLASSTYGYDPISKRLKTITTGGANPVTITYTYFTDPNNSPSDQINGISVISSASGAGASFTYQRDGTDKARINYLTVSSNNGAFTDTAAGFNPQDQLTGQSISTRILGTNNNLVDTWTYGYNASEGDALTSASDATNYGGNTPYSYNYDGVGNRTGAGFGSVNSANEYSGFQYNLRGDMTSDGTTKYGYDAQDRLISATPIHPTSSSQQEQFGYDSQNRMLWQEVYGYSGGTWTLSYTRNFVWDGSNMVAMLDGSGNLLQSYTYGPTGRVLETIYPADPNYPSNLSNAGHSGQPITFALVSDLSGNTREVVDVPDSSVAVEQSYGPFGENPAVSLAPGITANFNNWGFGGGWTDAISGLVYFQNRWYSPTQGRFMTEDPSGISGGFNLFTYGDDDPVNNSDPSGTVAGARVSKEFLQADIAAKTLYGSKSVVDASGNRVKVATAESIWDAAFDDSIGLNPAVQQISVRSGGVSQASFSLAGMIVTAPAAATGVGIAAFAVNYDNFVAGVRTAVTGGPAATATQTVVASAAQAVGASPQTANTIGAGVNVGLMLGTNWAASLGAPSTLTNMGAIDGRVPLASEKLSTLVPSQSTAAAPLGTTGTQMLFPFAEEPNPINFVCERPVLPPFNGTTVGVVVPLEPPGAPVTLTSGARTGAAFPFSQADGHLETNTALWMEQNGVTDAAVFHNHPGGTCPNCDYYLPTFLQQNSVLQVVPMENAVAPTPRWVDIPKTYRGNARSPYP